MSPNTVRKYVRMLEERGLITTEPTSVTTKGGQKQNGNLLFTIRPIQEAVEQFYKQQLEKISLDVQRKKYRVRELSRNALRDRLCGLVCGFRSRSKETIPRSHTSPHWAVFEGRLSLGRTYEHCLSKFAEQEGKLAEKFYTPPVWSRLWWGFCSPTTVGDMK